MQQKQKNEPVDPQVLYNGRWVSRLHFRAFVYSYSDQKLANSYDEFTKLVASGVWFTERPSKTEGNVVDIKPKRGRKCQNQLKA